MDLLELLEDERGAARAARVVSGKVDSAGEWSPRPMSGHQRAFVLERAEAQFAEVYLRLRADMLEEWKAGNPELRPATRLMSRLAESGECGFTLGRAVRRKGQRGQRSSMVVKSKSFTLGKPEKVPFLAAVSLLDRYPFLLEACAPPGEDEVPETKDGDGAKDGATATAAAPKRRKKGDD